MVSFGIISISLLSISINASLVALIVDDLNLYFLCDGRSNKPILIFSAPADKLGMFENIKDKINIFKNFFVDGTNT